MKKFMQLVAAVKSAASLAFTAQIMLVTVASMLFNRDGISISFIWQMMFLALIYGCLQLIAFSENYLGKMKTPGRVMFLGASMFVALASFALVFQWFPTRNMLNWLIFIAFYAVVFAVAVFALRTVFRLSGIKYNQMLAAYQANHEQS